MFPIQKFALENIYCAPSQDRQFNFSLIKITKDNLPIKRQINIYGSTKYLPDMNSRYHIFVLGNIFSSYLNLSDKSKNWLKDKWYKASDDMTIREFITQVYTIEGIIFPREFTYYSKTDEGGLVIALKADIEITSVFNVDKMKYLRTYSNSYFSSSEYNSKANKIGITCKTYEIYNNTDKVNVQNEIATYEQNGGKTIIYVNGLYTDNLNLNIPNNSIIEIIYDQSIVSKEIYPISSLRTFMSEKDPGKLKYIIHRPKIIDDIQFDDDIEIYISTTNELVTKGFYYYNHKEYATRNITDKDYSVYTVFINNQAQMLSDLTTGAIQDKVLVVFTRRSTANRKLLYSNLKLHELYKLPASAELDVMSNVGYYLPELRAESLENSDYFNIVSINKLSDVTKEISSSAIGYNGITHYYGNSPIEIDNVNVQVPLLYQRECYVYEYDKEGKYLGNYYSTGPMYATSSIGVRYVEFIKGKTPDKYEKLYLNTEVIQLRQNSEYKIYSAHFNNLNRITVWEDITDTNKYIKNNLTLTLQEDTGKKVKIVYLDQPLVYDINMPMNNGVIYFHIKVLEDRGIGDFEYSLDMPFTNIEIYLNNYRLTQGIDFFMNFPYISICNKTYIDYSKTEQSIHVRAHGLPCKKEDINSKEIRGFVSHGVLTRNNYYDIRDDRVFSIFINGKLYTKDKVKFSEIDNTVRITDPLNGLPYTLTEPFVSIKDITGVNTVPLYEKNNNLNTKISNLFNIIFKEPEVDMFNIISDHYYLFSPVVSRIIEDLINNNINSSIYTSPYNDNTILNLLAESPYKELLALDPVKFNLPNNLIEIHPHYGNGVIELNLHQYRFINNLIRIITKGNINKINLSGYISVTTTDVYVNQGSNQPGGIIVI